MSSGRVALPSLLGLYCSGIYAFLYLPLAVMFAFSFNDSRRNVVWKGFTVKWYSALVGNREILGALGTSLKLAVVSALVASALGLLAAYAMTRHPRFRGRAAYSILLAVPLMMPEIVMGVGLLSFLVKTGIPLNFWTLACAHALIALPYTSSALRARFLSLKDARLEEAAMDLGATELAAFWKVTIPQASPAILAGALLAFTVSFEDFVTSFFIAGIGLVTLPIKIYSMIKFGVTPEINALASVLVAVTLSALVANRFIKRAA